MYQNTKEYYESLDEEMIRDEIEILAIANDNEFFDLVVQDPMHYISIIEHYKSDDRPQFPIIVSRTLGNLFIKYQLNKDVKWIEVGFLENDVTDEDSIKEFKTSVKINKKHVNTINKSKRFEQMTLGKSAVDKKILKDSTLVQTPIPPVLVTAPASAPTLDQLFTSYVNSVELRDYESGLRYMELRKHIDGLDSDTIVFFILNQIKKSSNP